MGKTFWDQARGSLFYLHDRTFYFSGGYFSRSYPNFSISKVHFLRSRFLSIALFQNQWTSLRSRTNLLIFYFCSFYFFAFVVTISIKNQEKIKINLAITITLFYLLSSPTFKQKKINPRKTQNQLLLYKSSRQPHPLFTL